MLLRMKKDIEKFHNKNYIGMTFSSVRDKDLNLKQLVYLYELYDFLYKDNCSLLNKRIARRCLKKVISLLKVQVNKLTVPDLDTKA
jgi:hypothetical protein